MKLAMAYTALRLTTLILTVTSLPRRVWLFWQKLAGWVSTAGPLDMRPDGHFGVEAWVIDQTDGAPLPPAGRSCKVRRPSHPDFLHLLAMVPSVSTSGLLVTGAPSRGDEGREAQADGQVAKARKPTKVECVEKTQYQTVTMKVARSGAVSMMNLAECHVMVRSKDRARRRYRNILYKYFVWHVL